MYKKLLKITRSFTHFILFFIINMDLFDLLETNNEHIPKLRYYYVEYNKAKTKLEKYKSDFENENNKELNTINEDNKVKTTTMIVKENINDSNSDEIFIDEDIDSETDIDLYIKSLGKKIALKCHPDKTESEFKRKLFLSYRVHIEKKEFVPIFLITDKLDIELKFKKSITDVIYKKMEEYKKDLELIQKHMYNGFITTQKIVRLNLK